MKFIGDLKNKTWSVSTKPNPENIPYSIGFKIPGERIVKFSDLSFYVSVSEDGKEIFRKDYPEENQRFISSSQLYLVSDIVENVKPMTEYVFDISATNGGETFAESFSITTAEPYRPYPSWTYDPEIGDYVPPVEYPEDGNLYVWNENQQEWIVLE